LTYGQLVGGSFPVGPKLGTAVGFSVGLLIGVAVGAGLGMAVGVLVEAGVPGTQMGTDKKVKQVRVLRSASDKVKSKMHSHEYVRHSPAKMRELNTTKRSSSLILARIVLLEVGINS
jgi:hypothetical protein